MPDPLDHPPRWLVTRRRRPEAAVRLYCFAHSGGSAGEFVRWGDDLPEVEVWGVQLPGRGSRFDEAPYTRVAPLVDALVEQAAFDGPFAFFGHSLGALLAYETARALRERGLPQPEQLILSAYPGPQLPRSIPPIHHLSDRELFAAIQGGYGSLPAELADDPELLALVMASHRADFEIVDTHRHRAGEPLDQPFHVVGGIEDRLTAEDLAGWQEHTRVPLRLSLLPGGHFYLRDQRAALLDLIRDALFTGAPSDL
ncbi:surfactin synthase thioesterase subunit [Kitasatospora sp. MAA4]|uniref:thioesterase II family protein n=1 Tax=Kitasatospora sp. MAA4 TaxID=3035093 RepID=UPI002472F0C3|nr:alpha/beta fold hydrolase [Kitasatospora sp. MAA4]MDH6133739.1 surfactin synthase thioesterase subunit [Kitasatospora sp. MAA4]